MHARPANTTSHPPVAANALLPGDPPPAALRPSCAPPPPPPPMIPPPAPCAYLPLRIGKVLSEGVHGLLQHALLRQGSVKCMLGEELLGAGGSKYGTGRPAAGGSTSEY